MSICIFIIVLWSKNKLLFLVSLFVWRPVYFWVWINIRCRLTDSDGERGLPDPPDDVGQPVRDGAGEGPLRVRRDVLLNLAADVHAQLAEHQAVAGGARPHPRAIVGGVEVKVKVKGRGQRPARRMSESKTLFGVLHSCFQLIFLMSCIVSCRYNMDEQSRARRHWLPNRQRQQF